MSSPTCAAGTPSLRAGGELPPPAAAAAVPPSPARAAGGRQPAGEGGSSWLTAAIPMDNPYCSCKLTAQRSTAGEAPPAGGECTTQPARQARGLPTTQRGGPNHPGLWSNALSSTVKWPESPRIVVQHAHQHINGPNHLGLRSKCRRRRRPVWAEPAGDRCASTPKSPPLSPAPI